jgi:hypothetical protein
VSLQTLHEFPVKSETKPHEQEAKDPDRKRSLSTPGNWMGEIYGVSGNSVPFWDRAGSSLPVGRSEVILLRPRFGIS